MCVQAVDAGHSGGPERRAVTEAAVCMSLIHPNVVTTYHYDIKPLSNNFGESIKVSESLPALNWKLFLVQVWTA